MQKNIYPLLTKEWRVILLSETARNIFFSFISGLFVLVNILSCKRFLPNMTVKLDESQLKRGKMNWHFWSLLNVLDHIQKWRMFSLWKYLKTHFFRSSAWRKSVNIVLRFSKDIYSHSKTKKNQKRPNPNFFLFWYQINVQTYM